jgi:hypothetical protein
MTSTVTTRIIVKSRVAPNASQPTASDTRGNGHEREEEGRAVGQRLRARA